MQLVSPSCESPSPIRCPGIGGFTLVELLVTMAVMAILMSLAAPSFSNLIASNRISSETNALIGALSLARSEAIRRSQGVSLVGEQIDNLAQGWSVLLDSNLNGSKDDTDNTSLLETSAFKGSATIKRVTRSASAPFTYTLSSSSDRGYVAFTSRGLVSAAPAFFRICDPSHVAITGRIVQVNVVGKVTVDSTTEACS
jgi:type IV fimbrial biogenesis protein FimT